MFIVQADDDDDLTVLKVPREAAGFVTGAGGSFLRAVEEEWSTIMFFADFNATNKDKTVSSSHHPGSLGSAFTEGI